MFKRKTTRTNVPLADEATCTHCPHALVLIGAVYWCPCEDCHPGGLVQGHEPFSIGVTPVVTGNLSQVNDLDEVGVDAIHRLDDGVMDMTYGELSREHLFSDDDSDYA